MAIIVGGVLEKDGRYLLVQEAKQKCYGKWCIPAGHLDVGENIFDGAKREIKEETNCDVELTGLCHIGNQVRSDQLFLTITFTTKLLTDQILPQPNEILDVKWFSLAEVEALASRGELRDPWVLENIQSAHTGKTYPLDIISITDRSMN